MSATTLPPDLPDEVRELIAPHVVDNAQVAQIGTEIAAKRDEAKAARKASGIEDIWLMAEEAYVGLDDANRAEFGAARWSKPLSPDGPLTTNQRAKQSDAKSTIFVPLTARYTNAGGAKLGEILLPPDDKAFSFSETPVPDLIKSKDDRADVFHSETGMLMMAPAQPWEDVSDLGPPVPQQGMMTGVAPPAMGQPGAPGEPMPGAGATIAAPPATPAMGVPPAAVAPAQYKVTPRRLALESIDIARKKAKEAETRIYDWMVESQFSAEMRKVIFDAARIGVGVLKGPVPKARKEVALSKQNDVLDVQFKEKVFPAVCWVDPWNIFPDEACGENIHDGDYIFERDHMSARQVRGLKRLPGYIAANIDKVLEEGPNKALVDDERRNEDRLQQKGRFEVWYFYGMLTRDEMNAIDLASGRKKRDGDTEQLYVIVTLINDSVVKATINPLDSGRFPYHAVPWQRRTGHWGGVGVAEQLQTAQKMINGATRAMMNNAAKAAGSVFVINQSAIAPADGSWVIYPDKVFLTTADGPPDVRQAFTTFQIPNTTEHLMRIVDYALQLAEESTSIPLITQGQSGPTTPDTLGAANLQNNNANQLLRSIGYAFDDFITEPVVRQYYEYLLLDPDVPDDEKGDFTINAHGSVALVERAIQDQSIGQMAAMVANPIYGIDPKKWVKMFLKSKRLSPEDVEYTEEEQAKIDAAPPPVAPAVQVAQIAAETAMKQLAAKQTTDQQSVQSEERIAQAAHVLETGQLQTEQQRTHVDATVRLHELETQRQIALMNYANQRGISLNQAKVDLAQTAMRLQTERELNAQNNEATDRKHRREIASRAAMKPPVQAPGRARNGQAFSQQGNPS